MKCLNCSVEARQVESGVDGVELVCPECGHFSVSAHIVRERRGRPFDVVKTKTFLLCERQVNPDRCPMITSENVIWASSSG